MQFSKEYEDENGIIQWEYPGEYKDKVEKKIVSKEHFILKMIQNLNGVKYFYQNMMIGVLQYVSYKYAIKCKEPVSEVLEEACRVYGDLCS